MHFNMSEPQSLVHAEFDEVVKQDAALLLYCTIRAYFSRAHFA